MKRSSSVYYCVKLKGNIRAKYWIYSPKSAKKSGFSFTLNTPESPSQYNKAERAEKKAFRLKSEKEKL